MVPRWWVRKMILLSDDLEWLCQRPLVVAAVWRRGGGGITVVGLPVATAPRGSDPSLGGWLVANVGLHASYTGTSGRGPLSLKTRASLIRMSGRRTWSSRPSLGDQGREQGGEARRRSVGRSMCPHTRTRMAIGCSSVTSPVEVNFNSTLYFTFDCLPHC
jgi:hypothetical protein